MPKFPYTRTSYPFSATFNKFKNSPIVTVALSSSSNQVKIDAYIDTGAQICLFNNDYTKPLGIKDYKKVKLDLIIFDSSQHTKVKNIYARAKIPVGFLEKRIGVAGLLGVYGFLDRFIFTANVPEHYFELTKCF
jgi:hypothetical protein